MSIVCEFVYEVELPYREGAAKSIEEAVLRTCPQDKREQASRRRV